MPKVGPLEARWLLMQGLAIPGIILVSLLTWYLSLPKGLTGIQITLCGLALFQLGVLSGLRLVQSGAPSPTGLTSNFQADSLRRQAMKLEPSSPHVDLREYGKPPSANRD